MKILDRASLSRGPWEPTRWSKLQGVTGKTVPEPERQASWAYLVEVYTPAMERFVRSVLRGIRPSAATLEGAAEVVQDFLARCVEKNWLGKADKERGRFRSFVWTLLRRHVYRLLRHADAQRRCAGKDKKTFEVLEGDIVEEDTPLDLAVVAEFNKCWVKLAVDRALESLGGHNERYQFVIRDLITTSGAGSSDLAAQMGVRHEQLPVLRRRARMRFAQYLREELVSTVSDPRAYEDELDALAPYIP